MTAEALCVRIRATRLELVINEIAESDLLLSNNTHSVSRSIDGEVVYIGDIEGVDDYINSLYDNVFGNGNMKDCTNERY